MSTELETAERLAAVVRSERAAGMAKSWRSVTGLLDAFRLPQLTPQACAEITEQLTACGVRVLPPLELADRRTKVRLLLEGEDPGRAQDLVADKLVTARLWTKGAEPQEIDLADVGSRPPGSSLWIDVHPAAEVPAVLALLQPLLPGLALAAVEDLVQVDDLPSAQAYGDVRKVSTVSACAAEAQVSADDEGSKAGQLVFQTVELLVGDNWLVSCWHEPRGTRGEAGSLSLEAERRHAVEGVVDCWVKQGHDSVGALGLLLFRELARTYMTARRTLYSWLEQWELAFHRSPETIEQDTLRDLRVLVSEFQRRLNALSESRVAVAEHTWFPGTAASVLETQLDAVLDRAIEGLVSLAGMVRSAVDLLTTAGIREHLRLAEVQSQRSERLQDILGAITALLLVPTLIAGLFGANTMIPGQGHWSGFALMLALMVAGAGFTFAVLQRAKTSPDPTGKQNP